MKQLIEVEYYKLQKGRITRITWWAMVLTPVAIMLAVWNLETYYGSFPGVLEVMGGALLMLTGITAMLMTAYTMGGEYEMGTVRPVIARGMPRWQFLVSKATALWMFTLLNSLALWSAGGIFATIGHLRIAGTNGLLLGLAGMLTSGLDTIAIIMLVGAAYIGIGLLVGVITRSPAFTMMGGLGVFFADLFVTSVQNTSYSLSIYGNATLLLNQLFFQMVPPLSDSEQLQTSPFLSVAILLGYAVAGILLAIILFQRQELE